MLSQGLHRLLNVAVGLLAFLVPSRQLLRPSRRYTGTCPFHAGNRLHQHQCASFLSLKGLVPPAYSRMRYLPAMPLYIGRVHVCPFTRMPPHLGPLRHCSDCSKNQPGLVDLPRERFLPVDRSQPF